MFSEKWIEVKDGRGHRLTLVEGEYGGHLVKRRAGWLIQVLLPDGSSYRYNDLVEESNVARAVCEKAIRKLKDRAEIDSFLKENFRIS